MRKLLFLMVLFSLAPVSSYAIDPPVKMWEEWHYQEWSGAKFYDIELTPSDSLFITCDVYDNSEADLPGYSAILMNQEGDVLWEVEHPWSTGRGTDGEVLQDGSFIITGRSVVAPDSSSSLFLMKISQGGSIEWTRVYDHSSTTENGWGVAQLPDGGYVVCGRVNGTSSVLGEAWILRTDANGDTLWTDIWGTYTANWGAGVEYDAANDWIVVAAFGKSEELPSNGPHLLYYSLDGEYLFGTNYYPFLVAEFVRGFVPSIDGGYAFLSRVGTGSGWGTLTHTDALGEIQWSESVPLSVSGRHNDNLGLGFAQIDGGYICCGWEGLNPPDSLHVDRAASMHGNLSRFDADGNALWQLSNEIGSFNCFYSVVQLPEGGYIAAGQYGGYYPREEHDSRGSSGYLVRYAPEVGIEEGTYFPEVVTLDAPSPNPFATSLRVSYSLPEPMQISLAVYDITGRLIGELEDSVLEAGEHSSTWAPGDLPSGCYVIRLVTEQRIETQNCVFIIR